MNCGCDQQATNCGNGINFGGQPGLCFTQGDDVESVITIYTPGVTTPVDLTGGSVSVNLPRDGGGTVKRSTTPTNVPFLAFTTGSFVVILPDHGFVTGDVVQVAAQAMGSLPAPLAISTNYSILVLDNDSFAFILSGSEVVLTTQGTVGITVTLNTPGITISTPTLGQVTLTLASYVTAALNAGLAQDIQVNYKDSDGDNRVIIVNNQLDIYAQPNP